MSNSMGKENVNLKQGFTKINKDFVELCDKSLDDKFTEATKILAEEKNSRIIGLTGPTCSGKTTAAKKLTSDFEKIGKRIHPVSLDDFYRDHFSRKALEKLDLSKIDFDSPDTFDNEEFERFINEIFSKGRAKKPIFGFTEGTRTGSEEIVLGENDVLLFEGIQVLYPSVSSVIEGNGGLVLYVYPSSTIEVNGKRFESDFIRLCRRLVRDNNFRGAAPEFTFSVWEGVRKNEIENIFPHLHLCDVEIDTTLAYELNILAPYLRKMLSKMTEDDEHYAQSRKILEMFVGIEAMDKSVISPTSLYNEFV